MSGWMIAGIVGGLIVLGCVWFSISTRMGARRFDKRWAKMSEDEKRQFEYTHTSTEVD